MPKQISYNIHFIGTTFKLYLMIVMNALEN